MGLSTSNMEIYCVSFNDYKNTSHCFSDSEYEEYLEKYEKIILHEYIHYVNKLFCKINNCSPSMKYLSEGIAVYLSGQKDNEKVSFTSSMNDVINCNNCYNEWYLIVKYIIDNYNQDFFLELLKDKAQANNFLINNFDNIKTYYSSLNIIEK